MATRAASDLYVCLAEDFYGSIVSRVVDCLLGGPPMAMQRIGMRTRLPLTQVKKALCVLIEHGLVVFGAGDRGQVVYSCDCAALEALVERPRCVLAIKTLYGENAETLVEELLAHGRLKLSDCLQRTSNRLQTSAEELKAKFGQLAQAQMVRKCLQYDNSAGGCPVSLPCGDRFILPDAVDIGLGSSNTRKRKLEPGSEYFWQLNYERFSLYFRDDLLLKMIANMADERCVNTVRAMLKLSELKSAPEDTISSPLPLNEIVRSASKLDLVLPKSVVDQCLAFLVEDQSRIIRKIGDSGGGIYAINFERVAELMCLRVVESVVREKFDTKGVRIFRLLLAKGYLEQNTIESLSMLPNKEGKELLYLLLDDKFICVKPLSKTGDFAPARTFYLFYVDLERVARRLREDCFKNLSNLIRRRRHEVKEHKQLVERQEKAETIIANIQSDEGLDEQTKQQQVSEVEHAYLSETEKNNLQNHRRAVIALNRVEVELQQDLFILNLYLLFKNRR